MNVPDESTPQDRSLTFLEYWYEGVRVFVRILWFSLFFFIALLPAQFVLWLLGSKASDAQMIVAIFYFPLALAFASRVSGQLRTKLGERMV